MSSRWFRVLLALVVLPGTLFAQSARPKLLDAHVHDNGDPEFLKKLAAKLDSVDGLALLITAAQDLCQANVFGGTVRRILRQNP